MNHAPFNNATIHFTNNSLFIHIKTSGIRSLQCGY